jgi:hypothetical protein
MSQQTIDQRSLGGTILDRIEGLVLEAESKRKPLEIDPYRRQLFELFVTAEAAGYTEEDSEVDLSADGVCRELGLRWGLGDATRESFAQQTKLAPEHLAKMRMLWSVMRMWMEWTYAWQRWAEFHEEPRD